MAYGVGKGSASQSFREITENINDLSQRSDGSSNRPTLSNKPAQPNNERAYHSNRIPWVISTVEGLRRGEAIYWNANPSDISWGLPLRQTLRKTATGTVVHYWRHPQRRTGFDEFQLSLSLQSGNLLPYSNGEPSEGLLNFYDFISLVDAPRLTESGEINYVVIKYSSTLFPSLTLLGTIDTQGIRFNDSARSPHEVDGWTVDFIVQDTQPRLSAESNRFRKRDLLDKYMSQVTGNPRYFK